MKATIEVENRQQADLFRAALNDPVTRATVLVVGALLQLPTTADRLAALSYVRDRLEKSETEA